MEKTWTKALKESISEVFATMFFMVPEEEPSLRESLSPEMVDGWLHGQLEVKHEDEAVRVCVLAPPELARELAANILSMDPEDLSQDDMLDAFREMLNMVVGNLLTTVDQESQWHMGLPQAETMESAQLDDLCSQAEWMVSYEVEEKPLLAGCWSQ